MEYIKFSKILNFLKIQVARGREPEYQVLLLFLLLVLLLIRLLVLPRDLPLYLIMISTYSIPTAMALVTKNLILNVIVACQRSRGRPKLLPRLIKGEPSGRKMLSVLISHWMKSSVQPLTSGSIVSEMGTKYRQQMFIM